MATKVYFPDDLKDRIFSSGNISQSSLSKVNRDVACITSLSESNGALTFQVVFDNKNESDTSFLKTTITFNHDLGDYRLSTPTYATNNKPNTCQNSSQVSGHFTYVSSNYLYDYYELTNNVLYYPRLDSVLVIFFIIVIVCIYFPYRIFSRAFGRWFKI